MISYEMFTHSVHCKKNTPLRANRVPDPCDRDFSQNAPVFDSIATRLIASSGLRRAARRQRRDCAAPWRQRRPVLRQAGPAVRTGLDRASDDTGRLLRDTSSELGSVPAVAVDHVPHVPWPALAFRAARAIRRHDHRRSAWSGESERKVPRCARLEFSCSSTWMRAIPGSSGSSCGRTGSPCRPCGWTWASRSRSRRLRCALGHGRAAGRLGGGRASLADRWRRRRSARRSWSARCRSWASASAISCWPMRWAARSAGGGARDRRVRGRAERRRRRPSAVRRPARARPLSAMAPRRGAAAAGGRAGARRLGQLRDPGARGRRACVRPAVPCRGRCRDARRLARGRRPRSPSWSGRSGRTARPASPPRPRRTWRRSTAPPGSSTTTS